MDIPCGNFNWFSKIDLSDFTYKGYDIVEGVTISNNERFSYKNITFFTMDLVKSIPPASDLLLCRDCLVHLSYLEINEILKNICLSDVKYFLTTSFPKQIINNDIVASD